LSRSICGLGWVYCFDLRITASAAKCRVACFLEDPLRLSSSTYLGECCCRLNSLSAYSPNSASGSWHPKEAQFGRWAGNTSRTSTWSPSRARSWTTWSPAWSGMQASQGSLVLLGCTCASKRNHRMRLQPSEVITSAGPKQPLQAEEKYLTQMRP